MTVRVFRGMQFFFGQQLGAQRVSFMMDRCLMDSYGISTIGTAIDNESKDVKLSWNGTLSDQVAFPVSGQIGTARLCPDQLPTIVAMGLDDTVGVVLVNGPACVMPAF